jgi:hypothetical protein
MLHAEGWWLLSRRLVTGFARAHWLSTSPEPIAARARKFARLDAMGTAHGGVLIGSG